MEQENKSNSQVVDETKAENIESADVTEDVKETTNDSSEEVTDKKKSFGKSSKKKKKESKEDILEEKITDLTAKLAESNEKFLRLYSEFDNFRKRTNKEKIDLIKNASEEIIITLLPIIDDFERAIKSMEESKDIDAIKEGEKLIFNKINNILEQKGVKSMETIGQAFDPEIHEALTQIPAPTEDQKGKVVDEIQKGYYLNEKVIRFAKVVVGQ